MLDSPYPDFPPEGHHIHRVFQAEYSTLLLIASYKLPFVSCCQGIWMGLGFGIAGFGRFRVVSDGTIFAMPENAIGGLAAVGYRMWAAGCACCFAFMGCLQQQNLPCACSTHIPQPAQQRQGMLRMCPAHATAAACNWHQLHSLLLPSTDCDCQNAKSTTAPVPSHAECYCAASCVRAGLWPDVGFAFKAAHMPGHLGLFLGLSGVRLSSAADLLYTGIATHYIPEDQLQVGCTE